MSTPRLVRLIEQGIRGSGNAAGSYGNFVALGDNHLAFLVSRDMEIGTSIDIWRTDGTSEGTYKLASDPLHTLHGLGSKFFYTTNQGLWISDGSISGTRLLTTDGAPSESFVFIKNILSTQNNIYIYGLLGNNRDPYFKVGGLWSVNIEEGVLRPIVSINIVSNLVSVGDTLFFGSGHAYGQYRNIELWKSDGTEVGTVQVADIYPGTATAESSSPRSFTVAGNTVFFVANDGQSGYELWKSDGNAIGTSIVADINPGSIRSLARRDSHPRLSVMDKVVYFAADDGTHGYELWRTDGSEQGTSLVADINPGAQGSFVNEVTVVGQSLFFRAKESSGYGYGLWRSDGTTNGTQLVSDIWQSYRSKPRYLTAVGNSVFFTAIGDRNTGRELWKSDGTAAGTKMVADIFPGSQGSEPRDLKLVGNTLYFSAKSDDTSGRQLWALDVSDAVGDPNSGHASF
jgi:ELWxxDGT repeat protein